MDINRFDYSTADPRPVFPSDDEVSAQSAETKGFIINHLMYRIKDPAKSLPFYENVLGLRILMKFNTGPFTIYYLSYPEEGATSQSTFASMQSTCGLIELIHLHGAEKDPDFQVVAGNELGKLGFGHVGLSVPDVAATMERFKSLGVQIIKDIDVVDPRALVLTNTTLPGTGFMNHVYSKIGFIADPDGYWIEIVPRGGF